MYLFAVGIRITTAFHHKKHNYRKRSFMFDEILDAMKRITQGDFSVVMNVNKNDPFSVLAETVNKMAHELGSMENLRQDFIANVSHEIQSPLPLSPALQNYFEVKASPKKNEYITLT